MSPELQAAPDAARARARGRADRVARRAIVSAPVRTAGIIGVGAALPERRVPNAEIAARLGVDVEWIERRTGIAERRYAAPGQRVSELASAAARAALRDAGLERSEIDMVLVATLAADEITPATAPLVAHELGIERRGGDRRRRRVRGDRSPRSRTRPPGSRAGRARNVLVIGAEILSRFIDFDDRRTAPLFGDGAGALVVSRDADGQIGPFVLGRDGAAAGAIRVTRERRVLEMEGHDTFLMAVERLRIDTRGARSAPASSSRTSTCSSTTRPTRASSPRSPSGSASSTSACSTASPTSATPAPRAFRSRSSGRVRVGALRPGARVVLGAVGAGLVWGATVLTLGARMSGAERRERFRRTWGAASAPRGRDGCALVTGGSRGIGAAIACALAADGWPVGVNFRAERGRRRATVARIEDAGGQALALRADVTAPARFEALFEALEQRFGRVLVLVNNAGVRADDLAISLTDEDWGRVIDTNLSAAFRATRHALRGMIRARFGRVINLASVVGPRANAGQANYAAAKAGLIGMTKTIAVEVARRGVTVNAIAPGLIDTDMTADLDGELLKAVPARRAGSPEEVAACARFLASEEVRLRNRHDVVRRRRPRCLARVATLAPTLRSHARTPTTTPSQLIEINQRKDRHEHSRDHRAGRKGRDRSRSPRSAPTPTRSPPRRPSRRSTSTRSTSPSSPRSSTSSSASSSRAPTSPRSRPSRTPCS